MAVWTYRIFMSKRRTSSKATESDLFFRILMFIFGAAYTVGSVFVGRTAFVSYCESDTIWAHVAIGTVCILFFFWGLVLIAASFLPKNSRLQAIVEKLDGTGGGSEAGCLLTVLAVPIYFLIRLVRRISSEENID